MNYTAIVITAACAGVAVLTAAIFWAWDAANTRRIQRLLTDPDAPKVVDCEDHDDTPSPTEQAIIDQLRATPLRLEVTDEMRARAARRFEEEFGVPVAGRPATPEQFARQVAAFRRQYLNEPVPSSRERQTDARDTVDTRAAFPAELENPPYHDFERPSPLTADELAADVAAYEAAAAERARHAGVTWPTNPATVGIARYDDKAAKA
jgi:hypothetical protein